MNVKHKKTINLNTLLFVAVILAILSALFFRIHLGIEKTDEAFYAAQGFRLAAGNRPFADMWELTQTGYILLYPFFKIFYLLQGTEGIQLALRYLNFFLAVLACIPLFLFLRKSMSVKSVTLLCACYVVYAPFSVYSVGYNNIMYHFAILTTGLLLLGCQKDKDRYFLFSGVSIALLAFSYPTQTLTCLIVAAIMPLLLSNLKLTKIKRKWGFFVLGGGLTAVFCLLMLLIAAGGSGLSNAINGIFSDPAYTDSKPASEYFRLALETLKYYFMPFKKLPLFLYILSVILLLISKKGRILGLAVVGLYPFLCYCYADNLEYGEVVLSGTYMMGNYSQLYSYIFLVLLFVPACREDKNTRSIVLFQCIPAFVIYLVVTYTSAGTYLQANTCLVIVIVASIELYYFALKAIEKDKVRTVLFGMMTILTVFCMLKIYYGVVYRDASVMALTSRVEEGPCKGLYTTEENKKNYEKYYSKLSEMQEEGKKVCVLYHSCFTYLILDKMIPCAPSTWGIYDAFYEINNEEVFLQYFEKVDKPDVIFIVSFESDFGDGGTAVATPQLDSYVFDNYELTESYNIDDCAVIMKYRSKAMK